MDIKLLSIIVPIYKQEKAIKKDLLRIHATLNKTPYKFEIIGIVDGTDLDNSLKEAKKASKPEIKIYGYKCNKGKGQALRYGVQKTKGEVVIFLDSGMDIHPSGIIILLEHMKWYDADVIVGSKMHPASKVNYPVSRRILSRGYSTMVKLMFGLRIRDTQTGLKAYKRKVLDDTLDKLVVKRFAYDIELLAVAHKLGHKKIYDAPVQVDMDFSKTTIKGIFADNGIWRFFYDTIAVWYRMHLLHYYGEGRIREKVYDKDLRTQINTGKMLNKKQVIIDIINKLSSISPYRNKNTQKHNT